jgi:hypothetical protein
VHEIKSEQQGGVFMENKKNVDEAGRLNVKVPSVSDVLGKKHPEQKFRAGGVSATIWLNSRVEEGKKISFRTVSFEKNYKDKEGNWQTTSSLRVSDLPKARLVLDKAHEFIVLKEEFEE